jgi:hypothetical protein
MARAPTPAPATTPAPDDNATNDWMAERMNDTGGSASPAAGTPLPTHLRPSTHRGKAVESKRGSHN